MKKLSVILLVAVFLLSAGLSGVTAKNAGQSGFNENAKLYKGWLGHYDEVRNGDWLPGTMNTWLLAKFSRDWNLRNPENSPIGAWCKMHFTWYSNDYNPLNMYGWYTSENWKDKENPPEAKYKIEELVKFKKIENNPEKWKKYMEEGAFPASVFAQYIPGDSQEKAPSWMKAKYPNGVPKFIIIQDTIEVYNADTSELITEINRVGLTPKGLGK